MDGDYFMYVLPPLPCAVEIFCLSKFASNSNGSFCDRYVVRANSHLIRVLRAVNLSLNPVHRIFLVSDTLHDQNMKRQCH